MYSSSERPLIDFPSAQTQPSWSATWEITSSGYCVKSLTIIVLDFSLAFEGRFAHDGTSRRRRRVMWETDGSAKAARYAANPAEKREFSVGCIFREAPMRKDESTCSGGTGDDQPRHVLNGRLWMNR